MADIGDFILWDILNGHDCILNLAKLVSKYKNIKINHGTNDIKSQLLIFSNEKYKDTKIFNKILTWGEKNKINIMKK